MTKTNLEIKLIKSLIGSKSYQKKSIKGLGLNRIGQKVLVSNTPENKGMIDKARHLLEVKEVN